MSPKRAALPGKDALFGDPRAASEADPALATAPEPAADPALAPDPSPTETPAPPAAPPANVARHLQLCVWVAPDVAHEVDRARARLLMEHGLKVTKSQIVEAVLRPALPDLETLLRLLNQ